MTKFLTKAALAATVALIATPAFAAPAGNANFIAKAKIVKPVTIVNNTDLDFGTVTMTPTLVSETVTVADDLNSLPVCGSAQLTCTGPGGSADFTLSGGSRNQTLTLTATNVTPGVMTHSNGTNTVPFTVAPIKNVTLSATGTGAFSVGGQITVAAATIDGVYQATVNVVADYL